MVQAELLDLVPQADGSSILSYRVRGTAEELDGAIRVVPPFLQALGPVNVDVALASKLGRIAGAVGAALSPSSPGGSRVTGAEAGGIFIVAVS